MRYVLTLSILVALLGCSAAPAPTPGSVAKNGEACAFGDDTIDLLGSPVYDLQDVGSFDDDSAPSPSELSDILEYMPPSVDSWEKVLAFVDDRWVEKFAILDRESGAQLYDMYTYDKDGVNSGFIFSIQSGEFASFIKDGAFDDCRVRADDAGIVSECIFGSTYEEYASGPFEFSVAEEIDADTELTELEFRQIQQGLPLFSNTIEEVMADVAYLQVETASSTRDSQVFTVYYYGLPTGDDGAFYYRKGTTARVAVLVGDRIEQCTATLETAREPSSCLFGANAEDLMMGFMIEGRFSYEDVETVRSEDELTDLQKRQLMTLVPGAGGSMDYLFSRSDGGDIEFGTLTSKHTDHEPFTMYTYEIDEQLWGAVFEKEGRWPVALLSDNNFTDCTVAGQ